MKKAVLITALIGVLIVPFSLAIADSARSAEEAISMALEQNNGKGKVLGVRDKVSDDGEAYYQIKILQKGKVRIFRIGKK